MKEEIFKDEMINWKEEAKELKKQLEEINKMIEKCGFVNIEQVMLNYCGLLTQQKEFIKYLEDNWNTTQDIWYIKILQKYKEIIGVENEIQNK